MSRFALYFIIASLDLLVVYGFYKDICDLKEKKRKGEMKKRNLLSDNIEIKLDQEEVEMLNGLTKINGNNSPKSYLREKIKGEILQAEIYDDVANDESYQTLSKDELKDKIKEKIRKKLEREMEGV